MREEELVRIEQGDPSSPAEIVVGLAFFLGVVGLLAFIVFGVIW